MILILLFVLGLIFGSFVGAYSYRYPRNISIAKGRSFCPNCKHTISWFDNIPLLSFLILNGKCRSCRKSISIREPLIELFTGLGFVLVYLGSLNLSLLSLPFVVKLLFLLVLFTVSVAIFVIDLENQIIPDELVFFALVIAFFIVLLSPTPDVWERLLVSFASSGFLLLLNLFTRGKGMGLGDVKLALVPGLILGFPFALVWMFISFVLGALFGVAMIAFYGIKFKTRIAFGPYLILGFWIALFFGENLTRVIMPYLLI